MVDINKSIEQLEGNRWGTPPPESSSLIKACFEIRTKKLGDLDENDLRVALGQDVGLEFVVPLAIDVLNEDLFIEALYYEGDLLKNLLDIDKGFWVNHIELFDSVLELVKRANEEIDSLDTTEDIRKELLSVFDSFQNIKSIN